MTHRAKSFIVCLIGLPIIFLGWTYESRLVWDFGIITFVIAFLASLVKHDAVTYPAVTKVKKEKPISPEEYERGRKDFTEWLESFISDGFGDKEIHLDLGDKQKPAEVLYELNRDSDLGKAFLDLFIYKNRKYWTELSLDEDEFE